MRRLVGGFYRRIREKGGRSAVRDAAKYLTRPYRTRSEVKLKQWWRYSRHHEAELDPYRVLWVDPDDICSVTVSTTEIIDSHDIDQVLAHVISGEWDLEQKPFEKPQYECFRQHFCEGVPWDETKLYRQVLEGETRWRGVTTEAELRNRCAYVEDLYDSITEGGFKSVAELRGEPPVVPDDVKIMVGRDGSLLYLDGKHRLALAKLLDVEELPVNIIIRHTEWQALRNEVVVNGSELSSRAKDFLDHPDMAYLR